MTKVAWIPRLFALILLHSASKASGRPQQKDNNVTVVKSEIMPLDGLGSSSYNIELSDGTKIQQAGRTERPSQGETGSPSIVIEGSYSYVDPGTGKQISITYIADKNGFQPKGDAIPSVNGPSSGNSAPPPPSFGDRTPSTSQSVAAEPSSGIIPAPAQERTLVEASSPNESKAAEVESKGTQTSDIVPKQQETFDVPEFDLK